MTTQTQTQIESEIKRIGYAWRESLQGSCLVVAHVAGDRYRIADDQAHVEAPADRILAALATLPDGLGYRDDDDGSELWAALTGADRPDDDYAAAIQILPSLRPTEPDDDCEGMVGEVSPDELGRVLSELTAAGYEVSDSRDDEGRRWVWVAPQEAEYI